MNIGIILAGGIGARMQTKDGTPKQFLTVNDKPIIIHTLEKFQFNRNIDAIIVSCIEEYISDLWEMVKRFSISKVEKIVAGGETNQLSCYNAVQAAKMICENMDKDIVVVHDGVRPLIDNAIINKNIKSVEKNGTAITCVPCRETIALVGENGIIEGTTDRSKSVLARSPQSFLLGQFAAVHEKAKQAGDTSTIDACTLMQNYGYQCTAVEGDSENIKITTPDDYYVFRAILQAKETARLFDV